MMTKAKIAGNYANSVLARTESKRLGFDEAIMLDAQGCIAECTGENIFVVTRGAIVTPPAAAILEGLTRDTIMVLAADLGYGVTEAAISRDALYGVARARPRRRLTRARAKQPTIVCGAGQAALALFSFTRAFNLGLFKQLSKEDRAKTFMHPERG